MLERYFVGLQGIHVIMEACGTAHHWARRFIDVKHRVSQLSHKAAVAIANKLARILSEAFNVAGLYLGTVKRVRGEPRCPLL
jgi:hypothetical protein